MALRSFGIQDGKVGKDRIEENPSVTLKEGLTAKEWKAVMMREDFPLRNPKLCMNAPFLRLSRLEGGLRERGGMRLERESCTRLIHSGRKQIRLL